MIRGRGQEARSKKHMERILLYLFVSLILCVLPLQLFASEFSPVSNKTLKDFETVYSETGKGLNFTVIGKSLLAGKRLERTSRAQLSVSSSTRKAFLMWSGETIERTEKAKQINFLTPEDRKYPISAQRIWEKDSTGILYLALTDVTPYVKQNGMYGVTRLRSDPLNPHGKDPYSVAGWALVVVTENEAERTTHDAQRMTILLKVGLQVIKPGELYEIPLSDGVHLSRWEPQAIGIIGGHGRAGNGSGNLVNGKSLSGGDDWDGSSGKFWDIDLFPIKQHNAQNMQKELILTIDPLLQWLYPVGVVTKFRSSE